MSKKVKFVTLVILIGAGVPILLIHIKNARAAADAQKCISNMQLFEGVKFDWARLNEKDSNAVPTMDDLRSYLPWPLTPEKLRCPAGGIYTIGRVDDDVKCSIPLHDLALGGAIVGCEEAEERVFRIKLRNTNYDEVLHEPITGARATIIDESGRRCTALTDGNGYANVPTWPYRAKAVIISKQGYLTYSNAYPPPKETPYANQVRLRKIKP